MNGYFAFVHSSSGVFDSAGHKPYEPTSAEFPCIRTAFVDAKKEWEMRKRRKSAKIVRIGMVWKMLHEGIKLACDAKEEIFY